MSYLLGLEEIDHFAALASPACSVMAASLPAALELVGKGGGGIEIETWCFLRSLPAPGVPFETRGAFLLELGLGEAEGLTFMLTSPRVFLVDDPDDLVEVALVPIDLTVVESLSFIEESLGKGASGLIALSLPCHRISVEPRQED